MWLRPFLLHMYTCHTTRSPNKSPNTVTVIYICMLCTCMMRITTHNQTHIQKCVSVCRCPCLCLCLYFYAVVPLYLSLGPCRCMYFSGCVPMSGCLYLCPTPYPIWLVPGGLLPPSTHQQPMHDVSPVLDLPALRKAKQPRLIAAGKAHPPISRDISCVCCHHPNINSMMPSMYAADSLYQTL